MKLVSFIADDGRLGYGAIKNGGVGVLRNPVIAEAG